MQVTLCDVREGKDPCGERALITVNFTMDGKRYEFDACEVHGKSLTQNAREASSPAIPAGYTSKTVLPKSGGGRKVTEQLVDRIDYRDLRLWLEGQGDVPAGGKGRIRQDLQQKWIDAGEPRPI